MGSEDNKLNDLTDTKEWVRHLHSLQSYDWKVPKELKGVVSQGVLKPPLLMKDIVEFFTKEGGQVIDPFAGEGGILIGAALANRLASGNDLYAANRATAIKVGEFYGRPMGNYWGMTTQDAFDFLREGVERAPESQDLFFTDAPWGIDHGRTLDEGGSVPFDMIGADEKDVGNLDSYTAFCEAMGDVGAYAYQLLKPKAYALFCWGDRHKGGQYRVTGSDVNPYIEATGLKLKGVQHFAPNQLNTRRQVFGWWKAYVPLVDHWSLYIYRKEK